MVTTDLMSVLLPSQVTKAGRGDPPKRIRPTLTPLEPHKKATSAWSWWQRRVTTSYNERGKHLLGQASWRGHDPIAQQ